MLFEELKVTDIEQIRSQNSAPNSKTQKIQKLNQAIPVEKDNNLLNESINKQISSNNNNNNEKIQIDQDFIEDYKVY